MLNNISENSPLVKDFAKVLLAQTELGYCDFEDAINEMVDTRESIQDFKNSAHSHQLTTKEHDGIEYVYGFITRSGLKNATSKFYMMERDGWTVLVKL